MRQLAAAIGKGLLGRVSSKVERSPPLMMNLWPANPDSVAGALAAHIGAGSSVIEVDPASTGR